MSDCLFCRIGKGEIPAAVVYQDNLVMAFRDISPRAPVHVLLIPRKHISSLSELSQDDDMTIGHLVRISAQIAESEGLSSSGYRLVANCGSEAGQVVEHVHFHLLGGRSLHWPPG